MARRRGWQARMASGSRHSLGAGEVLVCASAGEVKGRVSCGMKVHQVTRLRMVRMCGCALVRMDGLRLTCALLLVTDGAMVAAPALVASVGEPLEPLARVLQSQPQLEAARVEEEGAHEVGEWREAAKEVDGPAELQRGARERREHEQRAELGAWVEADGGEGREEEWEGLVLGREAATRRDVGGAARAELAREVVTDAAAACRGVARRIW
eukprot:7380786-Prymnesium_polylepis.2